MTTQDGPPGPRLSLCPPRRRTPPQVLDFLFARVPAGMARRSPQSPPDSARDCSGRPAGPPPVHPHVAVHFEVQSAEIPSLSIRVPGCADKDFWSARFNGLNDLGEVLIGPARHAPVPERDVEAVDVLDLRVVKVVAAQWNRYDRGLNFLVPVLL